MATVVRLKYPARYKMPPRCAACGVTPAPGIIDIKGDRSSRLTLRFPACAPCSNAKRSASRHKSATVVAGLFFWVLGILGLYQLDIDSYFPAAESAYQALMVLIGLIGIFICAYLVASLLLRLVFLGGGKGRRLRQVDRAITVREFQVPTQSAKGRLVVEFRDDGYAHDFAEINNRVRLDG